MVSRYLDLHYYLNCSPLDLLFVAERGKEAKQTVVQDLSSRNWENKNSSHSLPVVLGNKRNRQWYRISAAETSYKIVTLHPIVLWKKQKTDSGTWSQPQKLVSLRPLVLWNKRNRQWYRISAIETSYEIVTICPVVLWNKRNRQWYRISAAETSYKIVRLCPVVLWNKRNRQWYRISAAETSYKIVRLRTVVLWNKRNRQWYRISSSEISYEIVRLHPVLLS